MLRRGWLALGWVMALGAPATVRADPSELLGPFPSIAAMCPELAKRETRWDFNDREAPDPVADCVNCVFKCDGAEVLRETQGLPAPIAEVVFFLSTATTDDSGYSNHTSGWNFIEGFLNVAIRVDKAWFLVANVDAGIGEDPIDVDKSGTRPVGVGKTPLFVVHYSVSQSHSEEFKDEHKAIVAVGSGPSGKVGVTKAFVTFDGSYHEAYGGAKSSKTKAQKKFRFVPGAIVVDSTRTSEWEEGEGTTRQTIRKPSRHSLALP